MELQGKLSEAVLEQLVQAQDEARRLGHGYVGTEHLVIAVAATGGRGGEAIRAQGTSSETLRAELIVLFEASTWNRYVPDEDALSAVGVDVAEVRARAEAEFGPDALPMRVGNPALTRRLAGILDGANNYAWRKRRAPAEVDDVLAALLDDGDSVGVRILRSGGVDVAALRAVLG